ncbi:MAG: cobyric acid synthase [Acidobacteriota bacterium]|jgi:adenosylcobyric acid synthase|nr:cobyric acid synthase [Acidobacteriota bacterium]
MAKPIMIQGTSSGVGKTILTIALCRIFMQDGYKVAPFKSQNMTTNTALTRSGEEIAVSQILQARAAGTDPGALMNPIVLKYSPDRQGTLVILNGKPHGTINAQNYKEIRQSLIPEVKKAYTALASQYDIIVIEGAGSPVELNLNKDDMVNMGLARYVNAPVLLAADIDRGGIFASLYGTVQLFDDSERRYLKAVIVNRFKGNALHFTDGVTILERITGLPVVGVIPQIPFNLPEEDSMFNNDNSFDDDYDSQFDLIADRVRESLDMDMVYQILNNGI